MNTPAHMALGLAVLGRRPRLGDWALVLFGALLPDLLLYAGHFGWPAPGWAVAALDSLIVWCAVAAVAWFAGWRGLVLVAGAAVLHVLTDLPFHAGDARPHFWPLSGAVFQSPVSFWDADHHGTVMGVLEAVLVAVCLGVAWRRTRKAVLRGVVVVLGVVYFAAFVHFAGHVFSGAHWAVW